MLCEDVAGGGAGLKGRGGGGGPGGERERARVVAVGAGGVGRGGRLGLARGEGKVRWRAPIGRGEVEGGWVE